MFFLLNYNVIERFYKGTEFILFSGSTVCMTKDTNYLIEAGRMIFISIKT